MPLVPPSVLHVTNVEFAQGCDRLLATVPSSTARVLTLNNHAWKAFDRIVSKPLDRYWQPFRSGKGARERSHLRANSTIFTVPRKDHGKSTKTHRNIWKTRNNLSKPEPPPKSTTTTQRLYPPRPRKTYPEITRNAHQIETPPKYTHGIRRCYHLLPDVWYCFNNVFFSCNTYIPNSILRTQYTVPLWEIISRLRVTAMV